MRMILFGLLCAFSNCDVFGQGMIQVQGGTFQMGSLTGDSDQQPVHPVTLESFSIDTCEITFEKWNEVRAWALSHGYAAADIAAGQNGGLSTGAPAVGSSHPVTMVNWHDIVKWCNARSEKEGLTPVYYTNSSQSTVYRSGEIYPSSALVNWSAAGYRLPTEAEWEFASKGGSKSRAYLYSGSTFIDSIAWYEINAGKTTHAVGLKKANELGIYDMSGNVWEWCWDGYGAYTSGSQTNPKGASSVVRVLRGGSFHMTAEYACRPSYRYHFAGTTRDFVNGFRCVRSQSVQSGTKSGDGQGPTQYTLGQNYPNPFNPSTTISFTIPARSFVSLIVFDVMGREIDVLASGVIDAGTRSVPWEARGLAGGVYFYRLQAGTFTDTKKLLLIR